MSGKNGTPRPRTRFTCTECGKPIEMQTIQWMRRIQIRRNLPYKDPTLCGMCFLDIITMMLDELDEVDDGD